MPSAHRAFTVARVEIEKILREQPDYPEALCLLGLIDAGLGHQADAIREARLAIELRRIEKDPLTRAELTKYLAVVYAWTGKKELGLKQLKAALQMPCPISPGQLRLHPYWDALRGNRRFDELVAEAATSVAMN
jgi:tetratricopeptide (TPR) repeat protein